MKQLFDPSYTPNRVEQLRDLLRSGVETPEIMRIASALSHDRRFDANELIRRLTQEKLS